MMNWARARSWYATMVAVVLFAAPLMAQNTLAAHLEAGDREYAARRAPAALVHYEAALQLAPTSFDALWRTSRTLIDIAEYDSNTARRKASFSRASDLARKAIAASPSNAEGYFHLSRAQGREALSVSARDRVKYAIDVRSSALNALARDSMHAGALHVLGRWHAEVMRLNGVTRMIAKTFMGGKVFSEASWSDAVRLLERANSLEPNRTVHQLALAQIYRDAGNVAKARSAFQAAIAAPVFDINDAEYKKEAAQDLARLK